jgi:hypothetical protein
MSQKRQRYISLSRQLDLSGNKIRAGGAESLAGVLPQCTALAHLNLWNNQIRQAGAERLAGVLAQCPALSHLNISHNMIGAGGARWPEFFLTAFGLCLLAMFLSGIISSKEDYTFEHVYLDMAILVTIGLVHCTVRYKPAANYAQPDRNLTKPKVLVTLVKDKLITLDMDVYSNHVTLTVVNARNII